MNIQDHNNEQQFVARQAIFDSHKKIYAYELLYRDSADNFFPAHLTDEQATGRMFFDALLLHGVEKLAAHKKAFINVSTSGLILELPHLISPLHVVIEIVERTEDILEVAEFVTQMRKKGYMFALDDYDGNAKWQPLLEKVQYIKLEVETPLMRTLLQVKKLKRLDPKVKIIVERIEDHATFVELEQAGVDLFQGYFFAKPEMMNLKNISPIKLVVIDLLRLVLQEYLDFDAVQSKVARDLSLTARVLKMANSACKSSKSTISSLSQAIIYLGEELVRQFITVLALSELGKDKPSELTKLGLTRAKFMSNMLDGKDQNLVNTAYLVGLVSVLDAILDKSMSEICDDFLLSFECRDALLFHEGEIGATLQLCMAIERDDTEALLQAIRPNNISFRQIGQAYVEALFYADETLEFIS
ncbi:HDOD domain-containing protein [Pseudoalteromonas tunicata]|uniref:EAL and HDOD domain-containing protein n=1 Tax=Pseudoalteromonas tunicata TaxID=314281 RepID=UPI00273D247E|nr:HDOD domain-containing protein [Pseudoalteromonas tunicata]MDP5212834.1 HDOD domain-containing protein [Pseudoalteromonas tunicata]